MELNRVKFANRINQTMNLEELETIGKEYSLKISQLYRGEHFVPTACANKYEIWVDTKIVYSKCGMGETLDIAIQNFVKTEKKWYSTLREISRRPRVRRIIRKSSKKSEIMQISQSFRSATEIVTTAEIAK